MGLLPRRGGPGRPQRGGPGHGGEVEESGGAPPAPANVRVINAAGDERVITAATTDYRVIT